MKNTIEKLIWKMGTILMCLFLVLISAAKGQDKVYSIDSFAEKTSVNQKRMIARNASSEDIDAIKVKEFRNLYYNVQPTLYYNIGGVTDATENSLPMVINVNVNAISQLQRDVNIEKNNDFIGVKLIIIEEHTGQLLPSFFSDKFPDLQFLVFKSKPGIGAMDSSSTNNVISKEFWKAHPSVLVIYNNLPEGN